MIITAHDSMHGLVLCSNGKWNNMIGGICSFCYALFSFRKLQVETREHHNSPASDQDPDYHDGKRKGFFSWYLHFLLTYVTWRQLLGMGIAYNLLKYVPGVHDFNLLVLWVAPSRLSTVQLFSFGTYLPHREPQGSYKNVHHARSSDFPELLSFLTCYHFGYHFEHHQRPDIPWWHLPRLRRQARYHASSSLRL